MSVVIETTLGDITVDLFLSERPRACLNFLKLCKIKYYNFNLFHTISRSFMAQTGDPTGSRSGGESIFGILDGPLKRFFESENEPRIKHTKMGLISFVGNEERMIGSQFFLTLGEDLTYLDEKHCVFGEVVEGFDILEMINEVICDTDDRPYQDLRITHTVILDDPYPDLERLVVRSRSPSPTAERLLGGRIAPDEEIDEMEGKPAEEIAEIQAAKEAKARATILEMVGDLPDADMAPPENVLFVCKLNPVTSDDDLEIIFSRFGKIKSCEVIRDKKTGDSLQYAFVEFEDQKSCENAYFKMDNVLIDDRRIHVDFSQSVSKIKWHGKGRGVTHYDEKGRMSKDNNNDIGKGNYKSKHLYYKKEGARENNRSPKRIKDRSRSPKSRDNSKRIRDKSTSPIRDKNKSRHERDKSFKRKDFISPAKSGLRTDSRENHKNRGRNGDTSRKNNSPPPRISSRSPTPRKNRYISPPRRIRDKSRSPNSKSQGGRKKSRTPKRSRDRSPTPSQRSTSRHYTENVRKYSDRRSRTPNKNNYYNESSKSSKTVPSSSRTKQYTPERKIVYERNERSVSKDRNKTKLKNKKGEVEPKKKEKTKKRKRKNSSEDSDSDSDKKPKKMKKSSSSSSDDENYRKKKSKKKRGKKRKDSTSDSDKSVNHKKSKSKKKKKKPDSD